LEGDKMGEVGASEFRLACLTASHPHPNYLPWVSEED